MAKNRLRNYWAEGLYGEGMACYLGEDQIALMGEANAYGNISSLLINRALTRWKWGGPDWPKSCDSRVAEWWRLTRGGMLFAYDDALGYSIEGASSAYEINGYRQPLKMWGYNFIGRTKQRSLYVPGQAENPIVLDGVEGRRNPSYDAVLCKANYLMYPAIFHIIEASRQLSNMSAAMDASAELIKVQGLAKVPEELVDSYKEQFGTVRGNVPHAVVGDAFSLDKLGMLEFPGADNALKAEREHYEWLMARHNEVMGYASPFAVDKRERLSVPEATATHNISDANALTEYDAIQDFIRDVKDAFGLTITCEWSGEHEGGDDDVFSDDLQAEADDVRGVPPDGAGEGIV